MTLRLLYLLLITTITLQLHTNLHQQTTTTYINGLINRQNVLAKAMSNSLLDYQTLITNIQALGAYTSAQINKTVTYLDAQRLALTNLSNYINVPLNPSPCNSTTAAVTARNSLQNEATKLKSSIQSLRTTLVNCVNCVITSQINTLILQQQNYLQVINQIVASNCTNAPPILSPQQPSGFVNVGLSNYKDNLLAKNWIYGNITASQYKLQVFSQSIKYNLTSCPISKPYVNPLTQLCFNCPSGMNYSLGQKTCVVCSNNFIFNLATLKCQSPCNSSQIFNTTTKKCQPIPVAKTNSLCPASTPFWNSTILACQKCPVSSPLYNSSTSQCLPCPPNTAYNSYHNQCFQICPSGQYFNITLKACIVIPKCSPGTLWNNTLMACQSVCPAGTFYNTASSQCQLICPNGTIYSNITKICETIVTHNCPVTKPIWNTTTLSCQICPQTTPVWNSTLKQCQPCPASSPVFNYTSFTCGPKICATGSKWNPYLLKCSPLNKTCSISNQGYVFKLEKCVPMCQNGHTYYAQNNSCSCFPSLPYFNSTTRLCQAPACPSGTRWNTFVSKCVTLNTTCHSWQVYNFTAGGCIQVCPTNIPYIKASNACNCTAQLPIFNFSSRTCVAPTCPSGTLWNTFMIRCSPLNGHCAKWQQYNFTTQFCKTMCHNHVTYIASNNSCACPPQKPIFNYTDRFCQEPVCPIGYLWNTLLLKCQKLNVSCKSWQYYNFTVAKCVVVCQVNQTYFKKYNNCSCPKQTPIYNSTLKNCTIPICINNTKWNTNVFACIPLNKTCLAWQQWNFTNATCKNHCLVNQTWFVNNKTCTCPPHHPFYNFTLKNCTIPPCANGTKWNPTLLNCTPLYQACNLTWQKWEWSLGKCISVCPVNSTYDNKTNNCTCPPVFPVFNPVSRQCLEPVCPNGTLWNRVLFKCSIANKNCSAWQRFNFTNQSCQQMCPINVTYYSRSNSCLCPPSAPLFDPTNISCIVPNCSKGYKYNAYLMKCSPINGSCFSWQSYNFTNQTCLNMCPANHTYYPSNNSCSCPPSYPLYNSTTKNCTGLPCSSGLKWNFYFQNCTQALLKCQIWQNFNFTLQACENMCPVNHTYYSNNNSCQCFPSAPVFNPINRTCGIPNCSNGSNWDTFLHKCVSLVGNCSSWQVYNFTTGSCVNVCPVGQAYHPSTNACQCPPEYPLWDAKNKTCIVPSCPHGYLYNMFLMKCSAIHGLCAINQFYDFTTQKCITRCQTGHQYYSNNDSCQCFPFQPYFNTTTRKCQIPVCPSGTVWNTNLLHCTSLVGHCLPWQLYNFTDGTCVSMCPVNQTYYPFNDSCSCFPSKPIFNRTTRKCEIPVCLFGQVWSTTLFRCRCQGGSVFNSTHSICQPVCSSGSTLNYALNLCQPNCAANQFLNTSSNKCWCNSGYVLNVNGVGCRANCPSGQIYNKNALRCQVICSFNQFVNASNQCQCLSGFVLNVNGPGCRLKCPAGQHYNSSAIMCQPICHANQFINSSNQCQCNIGYVLNSAGTGCMSQCSSGFVYNITSAVCSPVCGSNQFINSTNQCQCSSGFMLNSAGTGCIAAVCAPGFTYNPTAFKCEPICGANMFVNSSNQCQCSSGYVLDTTSQFCHIKCSSGFVFNSTISKCSPVCLSNMFVNATNQCQCSPGYVLNTNGVGCRVQCQIGFFYNTTTLTCQKVVCQTGYTFNPVNKLCEKNIVNCPSGSFYNKAIKKCQSCPPGYTYNSAKNTCEVGINALCPTGYTFNPTTKLCDIIVHNCPSGYYYSNVTNKCMISHITSPSAGNLLTANMTNYTSYYNAQISSNPGIKSCASPTPYYDTASKSCVQCPSTHPYFNLDISKCQNCGSMIYNSATYSCIINPANKVVIQPTIGRFISNVF